MAETVQTWEYLSYLQGVELHRLYRSPPSALAIFRKLLSGLARQYVLSMLWSPRPTPVKELELIVQPDHNSDRQLALEQLKRYHIIRESTSRAGRAISLVPDFARSLRSVLCGGSSDHAFGQIVSPPVDDHISIEELDVYARQQWEGILGYMVGSSNLSELQEPGEELSPPSQGVIELLRAGHLISTHGTHSRGTSASITKEGFAFVLRDINTQIWALLFLYADNAESFGMDKIDVLSFLFFIASLELGQAYSTTTLSDHQRHMLNDLSSLGVVYQPAAAPYFYPSRLATSLTADSASTLSTTATQLGSSLQSQSAAASASSPGQGYIIIETNYRLYAYTSSPLQMALLSLFVTLRSRHANLVTGKLTKSSVQRAVHLGITADQIISFLSTHAHASMRAEAARKQAEANARAAAASTLDDGLEPESRVAVKVSVLDATIIDQIHLWQLERDRMSSDPGYLLKDFATRTEYEDVVGHAEEVGVLVWKSDRRRMFFVSRIEAVQAFIRDRRERLQAAAEQ